MATVNEVDPAKTRSKQIPRTLEALQSGAAPTPTKANPLQALAEWIFQVLLEPPSQDDAIRDSGSAFSSILHSRPDAALDLAHQELHTWPYGNVPLCWRRGYEDAALAKAAQMLKAKGDRHAATSIRSNWLTELVAILDRGITLTGAPARAAVFESVLHQLNACLIIRPERDVPSRFDIQRPESLPATRPIRRSQSLLSLEDFQLHLDQHTTPLIIPGLIGDWPAYYSWQDPRYLLSRTIDGRRLVPVEIGSSYLEDGWSQKMMPLHEFMTNYLIPTKPKHVAYLAQHDLFAQIPTLKNDIMIPDYCYTIPPDPDEVTARTAGLATAQQLDEPMLNAWLGPKGTKTPLHTDPYHNILCQAVGYKYVRLYSPAETQKLYHLSKDENGIDMSNNSQVDISKLRSAGASAAEEERSRFPQIEHAEFVEAILAPGESLYIPLGWWHYVESLSTSFSVSFWWN